MNKKSIGMKEDKREKGVEFSLVSGDMKTRAVPTREKSEAISTSSPKASVAGDVDVALQVHGMKESKPGPAIATPTIEPEKPVYKIYADKIYVIKNEETK